MASAENHKRLIVIVGPTASGKSELAVRIAEACGGEIVNADSMQIYRGMDIGTAKPSEEMQRRVPHHLLDIVDPDVNFTASDFRRYAGKAIEEIHGRGRRAIVVGGTGLYLKALLKGLLDAPGGDEAIRRKLEATADEIGNESLHGILAGLDSETAAEIHPNNRVRVIRALEIIYSTGQPVSKLRKAHGFGSNVYDCVKIGIDVERPLLMERIERRVDAMIANGLVDEVRGLLAKGYSPELKSMKAIGYRQICEYLAGKYTLDEAVRLMKIETRQYAKRQLTWFRNDSEIKWFDLCANFDIIYRYVI